MRTQHQVEFMVTQVQDQDTLTQHLPPITHLEEAILTQHLLAVTGHPPMELLPIPRLPTLIPKAAILTQSQHMLIPRLPTKGLLLQKEV